MFRVNRLHFLQSLQCVQPGLSPHDVVEQSSCFVFHKGEIVTFNEEVACRMKSPLPKEFSGAVTAKPLLDILGKLVEEEIDIDPANGEFLIVGKRRKSGIVMEAEVVLPIDHVERPGKEWRQLDEHFIEGISMVQECVSTDPEKFIMTCIHIAPKWVEACDNYQLSRYRVLTGIEQSCLVRKKSIGHIVSLEMSRFNETATWLHFSNAAGLVLSCRRFTEEYKDLSPLIKWEGTKTSLPKGLSSAADKAEVFSQENTDENQVQVEMRAGKLRIKGIGASGWYQEYKSISYDGPDLAFQIAPKMLKAIADKHNECEICPRALKVNGGRWVYVTALRPIVDNGKPKVKKRDTEE